MTSRLVPVLFICLFFASCVSGQKKFIMIEDGYLYADMDKFTYKMFFEDFTVTSDNDFWDVNQNKKGSFFAEDTTRQIKVNVNMGIHPRYPTLQACMDESLKMDFGFSPQQLKEIDTKTLGNVTYLEKFYDKYGQKVVNEKVYYAFAFHKGNYIKIRLSKKDFKDKDKDYLEKILKSIEFID